MEELVQLPEPIEPIFSDDELEALILAAMRGTEDGATEDELTAFVNWAAQVEISHSLIRLTVGGFVDAEVNHADPADYRWREATS